MRIRPRAGLDGRVDLDCSGRIDGTLRLSCQISVSGPYIRVPLGGCPAERARADLRAGAVRRKPLLLDLPARGSDFLVYYWCQREKGLASNRIGEQISRAGMAALAVLW